MDSRRTTLRRVHFAIVLVLVCLANEALSGEAQHDESQQIDLDRIVSVWRRRQDAVRSFRAEWKETMTIAADRDGPGQARQVGTRTHGPSGETRLEVRAPFSAPEREAGTPDRKITAISSWNGLRNFQFTTAESSDDWPRGIVWTD